MFTLACTFIDTSVACNDCKWLQFARIRTDFSVPRSLSNNNMSAVIMWPELQQPLWEVLQLTRWLIARLQIFEPAQGSEQQDWIGFAF